MVYFCILYNEKTVQIKREGATGFLKERDFQVRRSFEKEASFSLKPEIESSKLYLHSMHGDWICKIRMKQFFTEKPLHGTFEFAVVSKKKTVFHRNQRSRATN